MICDRILSTWVSNLALSKAHLLCSGLLLFTNTLGSILCWFLTAIILIKINIYDAWTHYIFKQCWCWLRKVKKMYGGLVWLLACQRCDKWPNKQEYEIWKGQVCHWLINKSHRKLKFSFKIEPLSSPGIYLTCYLELLAYLGYQTFCVFHIKFVMNNLGNKFAQTELIWSFLVFLVSRFLKGTSRGLETVESNMNDSYYKSVLCWQ